MGILASIRSIYKSLNLIGCMITASHNPVEDNGCKLIDPNGDMLDEAWEIYATELVNSKYNFFSSSSAFIFLFESIFSDLITTVKDLCSESRLNIDFIKYKANVAVAHDTRYTKNILFFLYLFKRLLKDQVVQHY